MAISPVALLREKERRIYTSDFNYYRKFTYFFELRVPARLAPGSGGQFFFPLALAPAQYSMSEPFTVEATPTQGGGLYIEENGIVMRTIRISGHTGFKPRGLGGVSVTALSALKPSQRSFGRRLRATVLQAISGQKHFQYLQDAVLRTYADLKRDPATSEDTRLVFHNPKDEESWYVVPQNLEGARTADKRVLYPYDIELLVVGQAETIDRDFSEDQNLLDTIKAPIAMISSGLNLAAGALNDLTALTGELTGAVKSLATIIDNATTIITAATNHVESVVDHVETPYTLINSTTELIDEALAFAGNLETANEDIQRIPENIVQKFRQLADGLDRIGSHPAAFQTPALTQHGSNKQKQELLLDVSPERVARAAESTAPTTYAEVNSLGTALTPGDVRSAESELGIGRGVYNYTGATQISIGMGDTLVNLSARYLGDARLWQHIAVINGLKPPFISEQANLDLGANEYTFPGALGVGNTILIPSFDKAPQDLPLIPVLGVRSDERAEVHLLGTDLAMEPVAGRPGALLYDVPIDIEGGSVGPKLVSGIHNIVQSLKLRMRTDRGTDTLYKKVGLGRIVGSNFTLTDVEAARFKFIEAIDQDSRIASVRRVDFTDSSADALVIDADVELRGFTETTNVKATF